MTRASKPPKPLSPASLRESAYAYLTRTAATAAGVKAQLDRKITTWARASLRAGADEDEVTTAAELAKTWVAPLVADLVAARLIDDARFAEARAQRLAGAGKSRRVIVHHLTQKGIEQEMARDVVGHDASAELDAALRLAKKRRLGPFSRDPEQLTTREGRSKQMGVLARAGFDLGTCERVLRATLEEAEARVGTRGGW